MKHFRYAKLFGWLTAATMLLTTSCKDDLFGESGLSDEVTVTFTLTPEAAATMGMRSGEDNDGENQNQSHVTYPATGQYPHISDGSKTNMLIYAIYDQEGHLLEHYTDGSEISGIDHGKGQTIKEIDKFPVTIRLTLKRGVEYTVAFWAQNSECKAYNTSDLKKVEVIYSELDETDTDKPQAAAENGEESNTTTISQTTTPNNDETRDAFCRSVTFTAGEGGLEQNVLLYRPLAQINVGTSGYDFETITRNAKKKYLYSKIRLNRVARYLDVVEDKTYYSTTRDDLPYSGTQTAEAFAVADFGYAPIPAYVNFPTVHQKKYPDYPSYTVWDWEYDSNFQNSFIHAGENITKDNYKGEEFLKVKLYRDEDGEIVKDPQKGYTEEVDGYLGYASLSKYPDANEMSETFKYLSMCYVLTASTKEDKVLINNVKVWLATGDDPTAADFEEIEVVNLKNVPAQRNWRTNIVGNLLTEQTVFNVSLDKDFAGEYSGWAVDDKWKELSGPLAKGVYYDAKADEILISDVDGLLWLQRMVNGDLRVREKKSGTSIVNTNYDEKYPYYVYTESETGEITKDTEYLDYDGIPCPEDEILRKRILMATHQDHNENLKDQKWPEHKNFHFCGTNGPAKVKLMADIDLADIKWIPIGYDFKVFDTTFGKDNAEVYNKYFAFDESDGTQRAFCGQFNGNNHTISNLTSRRFTAWVHEDAEQATSNGPYDNVQWFPAGLFGLVGGCGVTPADITKDSTKEYTKIHDLRLFNVDVFGYHTAAAVAAIVNSIDDKIDITNCVVDGGSIKLSPMYRGDTHKERNKDRYQTRTFARGIYLGGIVGQYVADGEITGCEVRNVTLHGYRQIGGIVGSVSNQEQKTDIEATYKKATGKDEYKNKFKNLNIADNRVDNVLLLADKFQPYDSIYNINENNVWKNGFGWKPSQASRANRFVGGTETEEWTNNILGNVQFAEFRTGAETGSKSRKATIGTVPLQYIPILSSWFCDEIVLEGNYYGTTSVHTACNYSRFEAYSWKSDKYGNSKKYLVPFKLPFDLSVDYKSSPNAGMYVESVTLDGKDGIGGRSVITPEGVSGDNACVMFVTSRDREQFYKEVSSSGEGYRKPTIIRNVVLRGAPYAWAGILLDPNDNMNGVELENVMIYDVYRTLALNAGNKGWSKAISLKVTDSNFRGYTVPGAGWSEITYKGTTFEEGTYTGPAHVEEGKTYKAEAKTTFNDCKFKAPYIIDLKDRGANVVAFNNCQATSTSVKIVKINTDTNSIFNDAKTIRVISSAQGDPIVIVYKSDPNEGIGYESDSKGNPVVNGKIYDKDGKEIK